MNCKLWRTQAIASALLLSSCLPASDNGTSTTADRYLYVATGACYSGNGNTTFTTTQASNLVYRINLADAGRDSITADYWSSPSNAGDSPVGIATSGSDLLVLVENSTTPSLRRIERVTAEANGARSIYSNNTTALSGVLRRMVKLSDDWLLVSKSSDVEKMKDGNNRVTNGGNAFIRLAVTASNCITATSLISDIVTLPSGLVVVLHAAAGKSGFGVISASGYSIAGDCKNNVFQASPSASGYPTAAVYDSVNSKLLVAYAGPTTTDDVNSIYSYDLDSTTGAISNPNEIYDSSAFGSTWNYQLYGISSMTLDPTTNWLYVATATNSSTTVQNYRIEKLTYNAADIGTSNSTVLLRDSTLKDYANDTKCISQMVIGN